MNNELIKKIKNKGYYLFDLETINNINTYKKFKFYKKHCYDETIFYYNIDNIPFKIANYYIKKLVPTNINKQSLSILFYKTKFLIINNTRTTNIYNSIKNILLKTNKNKCNICYNKFTDIRMCVQCNFMHCHDCHKKIDKRYCIACKFDYIKNYLK
jgi:hypothetical protein